MQGFVKADTLPVAGPSGRRAPRETCSPNPDVTPGRAQGTSGLRPGPGSPAPSSGPGRHVKATEGDLEWSPQSLPGSATETSLRVSELGADPSAVLTVTHKSREGRNYSPHVQD